MNTYRFAVLTTLIALLGAGTANAQNMFLSFTSDDLTVAPIYNNVAEFTVAIEIDAPLAPGIYSNPDIVRVYYAVSGELSGTPSGFPAFALERDIDGAEFYAQGSSLEFEISADADFGDGVQVSELVGGSTVLTFNGREIGNGRFHPALLELNADGTGSIQNSDNIISEDPFQQVDFGEEYITEMSFEPAGLTVLTELTQTLPGLEPTTSGGGSASIACIVSLLCLGLVRRIARRAYGL